MTLLEELKGIIKLDIDEKEVSEKLFDKAIDPLMLKLVELIPTEFDDALYASKKEELKAFLVELLSKEIAKLEEKIDEVLD